MAKYLGGIKDSNIEIVGIKKKWRKADFIIEYFDRRINRTNRPRGYSIYRYIVRYEELTSESHRDYSLSWGIAGYLLTGVVGGLVGAILGGEKTEKHIVLCELHNGWQFAIELDADEFRSWKIYMKDSVKNNALLKGVR